MIITLDWETAYGQDYTLSKMTTESYVRDPRFQTIGIGVKLDDAPSRWLSEADFRAWAATVPWADVAVCAHNAAFDLFILSHHYNIRPGFILDTQSMAAALHGPTEAKSLAKLAERYKLGEKGKEVIAAKGKRLADFTHAEWLQYGVYCRQDCDLTFGLLKAFPSFPRLEYDLVDMTIRGFSEPVFVGNQSKLQAAVEYEVKRKADLLARVGADKADLMSNDKFAVLLASMGVDPPRKISPRTRLETWAFAKSDHGMKDLLEHPDDDIRWLAEARVGVKSTINETRAARFLAMAQRGPMPVLNRYAAAHTFRWGGGDKCNWQNLERVNKRKPEKGMLRMAIEAPPGHVVVAADSGAIEARVLAWLAGHHTLVEAFAQNRDVYSELASVVYGRKVDRKKNKEDEQPGLVGKVGVLGLGYSMGWAKLATSLLAGPMGADPVQFTQADADTMGVDVWTFAERYSDKIAGIPARIKGEIMQTHCACAARLVNVYRGANQPITELWGTMERALQAMSDGREAMIGPGGVLRTGKDNIGLPGGLVMRYPGLTYTRGEGGRGRWHYKGGARGTKRVDTYGGAMVENVVQALARCVVAEQALAIRAMGYKIATTTHDEIVCVVPETQAKQALADMLQVMKTAPSWAPGLPLTAEGGFAVAYGSAK